MKQVLSILLIGYIHLAISAQQVPLDSIVKLMENHGKIDTAFVDMRLDYMKNKLFLTPNDTSWLTYGKQTLKMAQDLNYPRGEAMAYERIGIVYQHLLSNPYKAIDNFQKSLTLIEKYNHFKFLEASTLGNIANIYREQGELKKALKYYKKISINSEHRVLASAEIGNVYSDLGVQDSAIFYYKRAIKWSVEEKNPLFEAYTRTNMSLILSRINKHKEALQNIEQALELIDAHGLEFVRSTAYANAGVVYLGNKDMKKASLYAHKALALKESLDNLVTQKAIWGTLADVYEYQGDYKNAFESYKKYTILNDSLASKDRVLEVSRREIQYEADKNQALAQAEIERQKLIKNSSIVGGSVLFALSIFGLFLYKRKRDAVTQKQEAEFNTKVANTELKALRAQMNPHFIFNSLNSVNDYISKNDVEAASTYLTKFAKIMRQTLENSNRSEISLEDDLKVLDLYLQVESMRLKHKFTYKITVDAAIDAENTLVPPLILQPFIENSIWHGISKKESKGHIDISIKKEENMLICTVDDNGVGRTLKANIHSTENKSMGISITKSRIDIINKKKNTKGAILMTDKGEGVRVEVKLPFQLAY